MILWDFMVILLGFDGDFVRFYGDLMRLYGDFIGV